MTTYKCTINSFRKCAKCGLTPIQDISVPYHRFPKPGSILRAAAWATYCWPDQDWSTKTALISLYKRNKVLCGRHFEDYCYSDKNRLSKFAVPGTKEYVYKTIQLLQVKILKSSNNSNSSGTPVTGCSTQPETIVGKQHSLTN